MADDADPADDICQRMQQVRREVRDDFQDFVATAKTLTDWRFYVKHHPWACVAAALAAGYMIVPRRKGRFDEGTRELIALLKKNKLRLDDSLAPSTKGMVATLLSMAAPALARTAMNLASRRLSAGLHGDDPSYSASPPTEKTSVPR